jgi:hypothetical protein
MNATEKAAVDETVARARQFLLDENGKRRPEGYYVALFTLQTLLRPATVDETFSPKTGNFLFDWRGKPYVYDSGLGELLMAEAPSSPFCDQVLCNAAAAMLEATGSIAEPRLRSFACGRLGGGVAPMSKPKRGRSSRDTWGRDAVIVSRLIPPLLDRFKATRNDATAHTESACSIAQKALAEAGIHLSENQVESIWSTHHSRSG